MNVASLLKGACVALSLTMGGCAQLPQSTIVWGGARTFLQTPRVDTIAAGKTGHEYFPLLEAAMKANDPGVKGASDEGSLSVRKGNQVFFEATCKLGPHGECYVPIPAESIPPGAALCVKFPWHIAQQRKRPSEQVLALGEHGACRDDFAARIGPGVGTRQNAIVVVAIAAGGEL